jgi:hypothetical protein
MGDTSRPDEAGREEDADETAKLELPSLRLPGFGRRRGRTADPEPRTADPEPVATDFEPEPAPEPDREVPQRRAPRPRPSLPTPPGWVAALVTGLVVGLVGAGLTYLSLRGCEAVRGTETCGGPGLFLLVVILVLMVLVGGVVLALLGLPDSRSTSFLAVGVLCVVVLLALSDRLFSAWMFLVVPLLTAAAYVLAHRVTTTFVEPRPQKGPEVDIR